MVQRDLSGFKSTFLGKAIVSDATQSAVDTFKKITYFDIINGTTEHTLYAFALERMRPVYDLIFGY